MAVKDDEKSAGPVNRVRVPEALPEEYWNDPTFTTGFPEDAEEEELEQEWLGLPSYINIDAIDIGDTSGMSYSEILEAKLNRFKELFGEDVIPTYTPEALPPEYWTIEGAYNPYGRAYIADIGDQFLQSPSSPSYANVNLELDPAQQWYMALFSDYVGEKYGLGTDVYTYLSNFQNPEDQYYLDVTNTRTAAENFLEKQMEQVLIEDYLNGGPELGPFTGELTQAQRDRAFELMGTTEGRVQWEIDQWAKDQFLTTYGEYGVTEEKWNEIVDTYENWTQTDRGKLALQITYDINYVTAALAAGVPIEDMPQAKTFFPWLFEKEKEIEHVRVPTGTERAHGAADIAFREITKGYDVLKNMDISKGLYGTAPTEDPYDVFYNYISGYDESQQRWFYQNAGQIYKDFFGGSTQSSQDYKEYLTRMPSDNVDKLNEQYASSLTELDKAINEVLRFVGVAEEQWSADYIKESRDFIENEMLQAPFYGDETLYLEATNARDGTEYTSVDEYIKARALALAGEYPGDVAAARKEATRLQEERANIQAHTEELTKLGQPQEDPWLEHLKGLKPKEIGTPAGRPRGQTTRALTPEPEYQYREELGGATGGDAQYRSNRSWAPKAIWRV